MPLAVVPFAPAHLDAAAELLAARHGADQRRVPGLPPAFADPAVAREALAALLAAPRADAWAALDGDRVAGYLVGRRLILSETELDAAFLDARAVLVPFLGYAARPGDAEPAYRALYAAAAARWVAGGYLAHSVRTTADPAAQEPWVELGFGRRIANGIRALAASASAGPPPAGCRRAGPGDADAVHALIAEAVRYHAGAPVFLPYLPEAVAAERATFAAWLADPAVAIWLAEEAGRPVGMAELHPAEGFVDDGRRPDRCAYLFQGHVTAAARGRGVGAALVEVGLAWAAAEGYAACVVDWFTANPLSSRFWPRRGFVPFAGRLERRIDPRATWASP